MHCDTGIKIFDTHEYKYRVVSDWLIRAHHIVTLSSLCIAIRLSPNDFVARCNLSSTSTMEMHMHS